MRCVALAERLRRVTVKLLAVAEAVFDREALSTPREYEFGIESTHAVSERSGSIAMVSVVFEAYHKLIAICLTWLANARTSLNQVFCVVFLGFATASWRASPFVNSQLSLAAF